MSSPWSRTGNSVGLSRLSVHRSSSGTEESRNTLILASERSRWHEALVKENDEWIRDYGAVPEISDALQRIEVKYAALPPLVFPCAELQSVDLDAAARQKMLSYCSRFSMRPRTSICTQERKTRAALREVYRPWSSPGTCSAFFSSTRSKMERAKARRWRTGRPRGKGNHGYEQSEYLSFLLQNA